MQFTFVTYNIHRGIGIDRLYRLERILDICRNLDADFLALQEVDQFAPRSSHDDMAKIAAAKLNMHYRLGLNVSLKKGAYGNATFSRYPIKECHNLNITWKVKKGRGCLLSLVQLPGKEIAILNLHLGLTALERMEQIKKILQSSSFKRLSRLPLVVMGDSNDSRHKLTPLLEQQGLADTWNNPGAIRQGQSLNGRLLGKKVLKKVLKKRVLMDKTFPSYTPVLRIDKVFASQHWKIKEHRVINNKKTRISSDHLPLMVRLQLGRS